MTLFCQTGLLASGTLNIDNVAASIDYTYVLETDNNNGRTLQGFSTDADSRMRPTGDSSSDYFPAFQKFFDYYGSFDYADKIVMAGFDGTDAGVSNGDVKLGSTGTGMDGRLGKCVESCKEPVALLSSEDLTNILPLQKSSRRVLPTSMLPCTSFAN